MQFVEMALEQFLRTFVIAIDDCPDFFIDQMNCDIRNLLVLRYRAAEKYLTFFFAIGERAKLLGQTPFGDHVSRELS